MDTRAAHGRHLEQSGQCALPADWLDYNDLYLESTGLVSAERVSAVVAVDGNGSVTEEPFASCIR